MPGQNNVPAFVILAPLRQTDVKPSAYNASCFSLNLKSSAAIAIYSEFVGRLRLLLSAEYPKISPNSFLFPRSHDFDIACRSERSTLYLLVLYICANDGYSLWVIGDNTLKSFIVIIIAERIYLYPL